MSAQLPRSIPFEQVTTGVPAGMSGRIVAATPRRCCAGTAITMNALSRAAAARSLVATIPGTSRTPLRNSGLIPSSLIHATTSGSRAQTIVSFPDRRSTQAIAVPNAPPPMIPTRAISG